MTEEIPFEKIGEHARFFTGPQLEMVLSSVARGNSRARLWRSAGSRGGTARLLWDQGNNVFYLSGNGLAGEVVPDLAFLVDTCIRERAVADRLTRFKTRALSSSLEESIPNVFCDIELHRVDYLFHAFPGQSLPEIPVPGPADVEYARIDAEFLEQGNYENIRCVQAEVDWMWSSRERFREDGFGYAALSGKKVVCWCTAEYASETKCDIGVETIPACRNRGIATATTARFVDFCLRRGVTPHWECESRNASSVRVAEKAGFQRLQETVFWGGELAAGTGHEDPVNSRP